MSGTEKTSKLSSGFRTMPTPIYISGDIHLNHKKLIEWGRPADFEMRELQALRKIPKDAYLIVLGDFCIGDDEVQHDRFLSFVGHVQHRLLVRGNHDHKSNTWYLQHGWSAVADVMELNVHGKRIVFTHIPVDPDDYDWCDFNVHAHTHGNGHRDEEVAGILKPGYHIEYAPETHQYAPLLLTDKVLKHHEGLKA